MLGLATGHILKTSLESVLADMDVHGVVIDVTDVTSSATQDYDAAFCMEVLERFVSSRQKARRIYPIKNVFDKDELRKCLLEIIAKAAV